MKKLVLEKNDTKKLLIFVGVILFLVYLARENYRSGTESGSTGHTVTYIVTEAEHPWPGGANLTYTNASGGSEQISDAHLPWKLEMNDQESGSIVYISAQLDSESEHEIHVSILVDGKLLQHADSTGDYSVATASGTVQ